MAWRIDKGILRGEIDNTERGRVTGKLWLVGWSEPIILDLQGDAWPDIAGTKLSFTNPEPRPQFIREGFRREQQGMVGDITASKKSKVYVQGPSEEVGRAYAEGRINELPAVWKNTLYIEWYDQINGRVLIESAEFQMTVSEASWELDEDDHEAQMMLNLQAMRDYLATIIRREEPKPETEAKWPEDMSEEEWEEGLQASDRLTDAAMEAAEKFADDPDAREKEAYVMGWDQVDDDEPIDRPWLDEIDLDAEDEDDEGEAWKHADDDPSSSKSFSDAFSEDESETDESAIDEFERDQHPLQKLAQDYALKATNVLEELGIEDRGEDPDHPADVFCRNAYQIMGKLAGVLNSGTHEMPRGMILATTKRCMNWADEGMAALRQLSALHPEPQAQQAFSELLQELAALREGIVQLRTNLQDES